MDEGTLAAEEEPMVRLWLVVGVGVWLLTGGLAVTVAVAKAAEEAFREDIDVMWILRLEPSPHALVSRMKRGAFIGPPGCLLASGP